MSHSKQVCFLWVSVRNLAASDQQLPTVLYSKGWSPKIFFTQSNSCDMSISHCWLCWSSHSVHVSFTGDMHRSTVVCYNPLHVNVVKMPSLLVSERPKRLLHRLFSICLMAISVATFAAKISFCAAPTVSGIMHLVPAEVRYSKACWRAWFCRWEVVVRPCQIYCPVRLYCLYVLSKSRRL